MSRDNEQPRCIPQRGRVMHVQRASRTTRKIERLPCEFCLFIVGFFCFPPRRPRTSEPRVTLRGRGFSMRIAAYPRFSANFLTSFPGRFTCKTRARPQIARPFRAVVWMPTTEPVERCRIAPAQDCVLWRHHMFYRIIIVSESSIFCRPTHTDYRRLPRIPRVLRSSSVRSVFDSGRLLPTDRLSCATACVSWSVGLVRWRRTAVGETRANDAGGGWGRINKFLR